MHVTIANATRPDGITASSGSPADPTVPLFWAFIVAHVVGWTVVPVIVQQCLPLDTIEMLSWGHEWQWGYYKHPPLPAWIAEGCRLLCGSADWPLYLVSQLCVALSFIAAWMLAREVLAPWPALVAVMLLELCPFLNYTTPQWNNNGPPKPAWAFAILWLFLALVKRDSTQRRWWFWPAAGAALGVAMLAKYDVVLLGATMVGFLVLHPAARWVWKTPGPFLMLAVAALIVSPHVAWLLAADAPTIAYIRSRVPEARNWTAHVVHPSFFLVAQALAVGGIPLLVATVFGWRWRLAPLDDDRRFARDYVAAMVFGPPLLAIAASAATGMKMIALWGSPMWTFFGVLVMLAFQPEGARSEYRRLALRCAACGVAVLVAFGVAKTFHGELTGRPRRIDYPGRLLADEVERRWDKVADVPLTIVAGDAWLAGVASFYGNDRPSVYPWLEPAWAPWTSDEALRRNGGVLLWQGQTNTAAGEWLARFPEAQVLPPLELPVPGVVRDLDVRVQVAIVPPGGKPSGGESSPSD
jgi:4-amino-4-deoxy-L-arabinose transferase-like glycosyltransferase